MHPISRVTHYDSRYGSGDDWVNEKVGGDGKLQAQAASDPQCKRGSRNDHPVCVLVVDGDGGN